MSGRSLTEAKRARSFGSPMGTEAPVDAGRPSVSDSDPSQVRKAMSEKTAPVSSAPASTPASKKSPSDFATGVDYSTNPSKYAQDIDKAVDKDL